MAGDGGKLVTTCIAVFWMDLLDQHGLDGQYPALHYWRLGMW